MLHATHRRWLIQWRESSLKNAAYPRALLAPSFPVPKGLDPQAAALLPNIDYNQSMLASLVERPARTVINDIACCYAADPFLDAEHFGIALRKRGLNALSNWPSGIQFGADFAGLMDQVDLGYERELRQMRVLAQAGFNLYPVVSSSEQARHAYDSLKPAGLIFAPTPGLPMDAAELAARIDSICQVMGSAIPLIALGAERGAPINPSLTGVVVCN